MRNTQMQNSKEVIKYKETKVLIQKYWQRAIESRHIC